MDEMLIQLMLGLVELVFEVLLEFAGEAVLDLLARAAADLFKPAETPDPVWTFFACGFLGAVAGAGCPAACCC